MSTGEDVCHANGKLNFGSSFFSTGARAGADIVLVYAGWAKFDLEKVTDGGDAARAPRETGAVVPRQ